MIKVEKRNVWSRVLSFDTEVEEAELRKALRFKAPNAFWTRRFRYSGWDGYYSFYNRRTQTFPTGMLELMPETLSGRIAILDKRIVPEPNARLMALPKPKVDFRDFQFETIGTAVEKVRCAIESPTGSGKTEIAIGITYALAVRTLFCVHLENLLWQAKERFEKRMKIKVGVISAGTWDPKEITIAMIPTIYSRIKNKDERTIRFLMKDVDCIFADECHHVSSAQSWEVPMKYCEAYYRYGLSATTMLKDDLGNARLIGQTGPVISAVSKQELIDRGLIARPRIKMYGNELQVAGYAKTKLSWQAAYRIFIEENIVRNRIIVQLANKKMFEEDKQVLIIVHTLRHAAELMNSFERKDKIKLITGKVNGYERQILLKLLDEKAIMGVVATPIFDEGADIPQLRVLILGGGGKSPIKLIQRMGRGMRPKKVDNTVEIIDFLDGANVYTRRHAQMRKRVYEADGFELEVCLL